MSVTLERFRRLRHSRWSIVVCMVPSVVAGLLLWPLGGLCITIGMLVVGEVTRAAVFGRGSR